MKSIQQSKPSCIHLLFNDTKYSDSTSSRKHILLSIYKSIQLKRVASWFTLFEIWIMSCILNRSYFIIYSFIYTMINLRFLLSVCLLSFYKLATTHPKEKVFSLLFVVVLFFYYYSTGSFFLHYFFLLFFSSLWLCCWISIGIKLRNLSKR